MIELDHLQRLTKIIKKCKNNIINYIHNYYLNNIHLQQICLITNREIKCVQVNSRWIG